VLAIPAHASDGLPSDEEAAIAKLLKEDASQFRLSHAQAKALMEGVDWNGVDRLRIELDDNLFEPEDIYLKLHRPYRITLVNIGFESHDIAGEAFFSSFIVKKVRNRTIEVDAHHLERLLIRPKEEIELWLVPTRVAKLHFICTLPGHYEEGMAGHIHIHD
jgi:uncharacterized cupredoxin-like copper-binding protein